MLYCFQLASILPHKTVAERGPAAHSLRVKKKTVRKQGGPSAAPSPLPTPSVQSKRAHVEEVDDEAGVPASQLMHSSNAQVHSVSPSLACVSEMFLILCIFLRRLPRRIPYICSMRGSIPLLTALQGRTAISTTSVIWVVAKYLPLLEL